MKVTTALKAGIPLALIALLAFDGISLTNTHLTAADQAGQAAIAAAEEYQERRNVDRAFEVAVAFATDHGARIEATEFLIAPDGEVTLTYHRKATLILLPRIGFDVEDVGEKGEGRPPA